MVPFNRFNIFSDDLSNSKHDFSTHIFKIMLTNVTPDASDEVFSDIVEIAAVNGYPAGGIDTLSYRSLEGMSEKIKAPNVVFTASGGSIGPLRYAVAYNDTQTSPSKPLVGWWDYGSSVTLLVGETLTW